MKLFGTLSSTSAWIAGFLITSNALVSAYSHQHGPNVINRWMHAANPDDIVRVEVGNGTYDQLIDHDNPDLGTFQQFYYWSNQYWKGPGSPVILFTPGEANVTGYQSYMGLNRTTGVLAQELGAAVVVLEHRYWGTSTPYLPLSTSNLKYLTLRNSIADLVKFAQDGKVPFDTNGTSTADKAPWLLVGGSYSGALAAWTESVSPGTFWAYWASSAPVNAMDYWQYFAPVQQGMAKNCSKDVALVIDHIDQVGTNGTDEEKQQLQNQFGLGDLQHYDDFAS
jgi:hypothetical protein